MVFARLNSAKPKWSAGGEPRGKDAVSSACLRSSAAAGFGSRVMVKNRQDSPAKIPQPLSLELGVSLFALTGEEPGREKLLAEPFNAIRKKLKHLLGFGIPVFRISRSSRLKDDEYRILFRGIEAGRGRLELGWYSSNRNFTEGAGVDLRTKTMADLKQVPGPVPGRIVDGPGAVCLAQTALHSNPRAAIPDMMKNPENIRSAAKAASSVIIRHVQKIIQKRAPELLGRDEVEAILDAAEEKYPVVTGEVKSLLSLGVIREIFQNLVNEGVSIRHITVILETLADWGNFGTANNDTIIEQIRQSLRRQICLEYADETMTLRVFNLDSKLERKFADHSPMFMTDTDKGDSAGADEYERLADLVVSAVEEMKVEGYPPVILCSPKVRSSVKEAARRKLPDLAVLSYLEIPSDINVVPLGEIGLEGNTRLSSVPGASVHKPETDSVRRQSLYDSAEEPG